MGFLGTLEEIGKSALKSAEGELKKINVGKAVRRTLQEQVKDVEAAIVSPATRAASGTKGVLNQLQDTLAGLNNNRWLPFILIGGIVVIVIAIRRR